MEIVPVSAHRDSEFELDSEAELLSKSNKALFLEKVRQSNAACQNGDFATAIQLYTEAIVLDPTNHVLYSNRSAAYIKEGKYAKSLQDAIKARELNPKWPKAYYRQGMALQCLGRHSDALAAFSSGLAQDPKNLQLLAGLVEAAMKSPLRATLEPTYRQLQTMRLDKSPFVISSVIGQELLASGHHAASVVVLESALRIGTCSLKLRGSVFSALSSAYWALNSLDRAIAYMQQDLAVAKSLGDQLGECRAHGNLGSAYFSKGNYKEALTSHRYQLVLAMKSKDTQAAACALTSLGHVYTAIGDYPNALASHKQCVQLVRQMGDRLQEAREIGNVGAVFLAMGDFDKAVECHMEHLWLAKQLGNKVEEARAYSNLGSSHHYRRNFEQAITFHNHVLQIAQELRDRTVEARAYAGLGHAARCMGDYQQAKKWHERQLDMALSIKDKMAEGRACSNLGIVYQLIGDFDAALKLHQAHLNLARVLNDRAGMGRAYGNIGNAYSAMGRYEQAIKFHKQELTISKEVNDRSAEASTHGNLAVAYQALNMQEMALLHYHSHLSIARELKDAAGEACALLNLGNCHSSRGEFSQSAPYYENFLRLSQELQDVEGEAKACHFLGYAHYCLGNYQEAIRYYEQDLALAKDLQDRMNMGRAYCNLGLSHLALGNYDAALECQKYFLAITQMIKHVQGKFRALGNLGDVLMKMKNIPEAVQVYQKQLLLAKQSNDKSLEVASYGALGLCHRQMKCFDKALGYHTQELTIRQEMSDLKGECRAHGHLGAVHMSLGNYTHAMKCYEEQLERAKELRDCGMEAQALGNMGISRLNMGHYEDAIGFIEQQLALLEQLGGTSTLVDKGRAFGNLGDCYDALGDFEEAVKCHEQYLTIALKAQSLRDQERAYRGLGNSQRCLGNLQQSLVCFEKRLVVAHDLANAASKAAAYGELGTIHSQLGNYEQAVSCLEHQKALSREIGDKAAEADAACGLGNVYQQMGEYDQALRYHQMDLAIAEETSNMASQGRAYGNLGVVYESLRNYEQAVLYQEQHLSIAAQINDKVAKTLAYGSLGRVHHALGNIPQAVAYLQQGLQIAEQLSRREDEAKIRHRLGLALWGHGELEASQQQLYQAAELFENIRHEAKGSSEYKLSLFDLQTACYQALQRVLVTLGRHEEALVVAERGRTRAFVDLLLERQMGGGHGHSSVFTPTSVEQIVETVNKQKATVLYYSLAAGFLYMWVIIPGKGVVTFHESNIGDINTDTNPGVVGNGSDTDPSLQMPSQLEHYVARVREALGVEIPSGPGGTLSETESEGGDIWHQHLEELGDKMLQENDKSGFLRMVNRGHLFNSSNYSLSSLFSVGSVTGSIASGSTSRAGSTRSRRFHWQGPAPLHFLYNLLIAPVEEFLPCGNGQSQELLFILDGDLYLVPFAMLKGESSEEYLCEQYSMCMVPSISAIRASQKANRAGLNQANRDIVSALVVGNPKQPSVVAEQWGWNDIPQAQQEATLVGEMLATKPLVGNEATKDAVLSQLATAECIHFATHISWKLSAIVLSPSEYVESQSPKYSQNDNQRIPDGVSLPNALECCEDSSLSSASQAPPLSDFLLSAADILNLRLTARLVVISSCHTRSHHGRVHSDGLVGLTRALLAAGAQCVVVSLWPVPDTAVKILLRTFYSSLLQGSRVSVALAEAMRTIQTTKHFAHPANWASFILIGNDIKLSSQVALLSQSLADLLKTPDKCRDAFRVVLHLVEKSLQRIHRGHRNAMYTTQKSIENKVGHVTGWKELLISVGFRFEPASNGLPASVFFPQSDPGERLTQCSTSLQALLGLSTVSLNAFSKLLSSSDCAESIIQLLTNVINQLPQKEHETENIECPVSVKLWSIPGCHELLASLGFDLMEVGRDEVTLRMGKQANRRTVQFAQQALLAIFADNQEVKSVAYENSSSLESLDSEPSETMPTPPPSVIYPPPHSSLGSLMLGMSTGAFTSYVRTRGEPDGRTATSGNDQKNRDSDTFTPSPVDTLSKCFANSNGKIITNAVQNGPHIALALAHQRKIRTMYGNESPSSDGNKRPDSSSSASSVTDWDSGQTTIRRQGRDYDTIGYHSVSSELNRKDLTIRNVRYLPVPEINTRPLPPPIPRNAERFSRFENTKTEEHTFMPSKHNVEIVSAHSSLAPKTKNISRFLDSLSHYEEINPKTTVPIHQGFLPKTIHNVEPSAFHPVGEYGEIKSLKGSSKNRSAKMKDDLALTAADVLDIRVPSEKTDFKFATRMINKYPISRLNPLPCNDHVLGDTILNPRIPSMTREPAITEVYHDRTMGLGLAPSLSKLLASDNAQNFLDESIKENCIDLGTHQEAHSSRTVIPLQSTNKKTTQRLSGKPQTSVPNKIQSRKITTHKSNDSTSMSVDSGNYRESNKDTLADCGIRDDGDGGSFTESVVCPSQKPHRPMYSFSSTSTSNKNYIHENNNTTEASTSSSNTNQRGGESPNLYPTNPNWHNIFTSRQHKNPSFALETDGISQSGASESECSDIDSNSSQKMISTVRRNPRHTQMKDLDKNE